MCNQFEMVALYLALQFAYLGKCQVCELGNRNMCNQFVPKNVCFWNFWLLALSFQLSKQYIDCVTLCDSVLLRMTLYDSHWTLFDYV